MEKENLPVRILVVAVVIFGIPLCGLMVRDPHADERQQVQRDLREIKRLVSAWKIARGSVWVPPAAEFVKIAGHLKDPFSGKPYVYKLSSQDQYYIYSVGPNGRDEDAAGDDILPQIGM